MYPAWHCPFGRRTTEVASTCVSSRLLSVGDTFTNMSVLAVPPRESDISMVSLWFLYGMCACSVARAEITSPRALSDLLIACASFSCSPVEPDFLTLRRRLSLESYGAGLTRISWSSFLESSEKH